MKWPSKKVIPIFLACAVAVGGIVFAELYSRPKNAIATLPQLSVESVADEVQKQALDKDTDGDGLKDWEETLWHTDHKKIDTDSDGTPDGDEVRASRNPAVKGPEDSLEQAPVYAPSTEKTAKPGQISTSPSATSQAAQDLFATYISLKKSGVTITPDVENQITQQLLTTTSYSMSQAKQYSASDLELVNDSVSAEIDYGNKMGALIEAYSPQGENELVVLERAVDSQDRKDLTGLDIIAASYTKLLTESLKVHVPRNAGALHLSIINDLSTMAESVKKFQLLFDDPLTTFTALKQYEDAIVDLGAAIKAAKLYFSNKGIEYEQGQPGYIFVNLGG